MPPTRAFMEFRTKMLELATLPASLKLPIWDEETTRVAPALLEEVISINAGLKAIKRLPNLNHNLNPNLNPNPNPNRR